MRTLLAAAALVALLPPAAAKGEPLVQALDDGGEADYRFEPARLDVARSVTVRVQGGHLEPHTLTHDAPQSERKFSTGHIGVNGNATFVAPAEPGEYPFLCVYHPGMRGTLVVGGAAVGTPPSPTSTDPTPDTTEDREPIPLPAMAAAAALALVATLRRRA